jgi:para-nitrobenzyl esterase
LGIPYAAPPVGDLRWRSPRQVASWAGIRDATHYGNRCAALVSTNGAESLTEDCLFLNVQRPAGTRRGNHLPVYVFFHGGGGTTGSSNQHDGTKIVSEGGIIVVTLNYRLGVFGGIGHPALTAESGESGNYGFQDQQAALKWVHRHISDFGGDPGRVTIGGHSSGAQNVCYHLSAPESQGLFSAGIIQSGPDCFSQTQADAESTGSSIATTVGCTDPSTVLACLRGADTRALLQAFQTAQDSGYNPVIVTGTKTMMNDPRQNVATGKFAHVPVVIGTNLDEARTFFGFLIGASEQGYVDFINAVDGGKAPAILGLYSWQSSSDDENLRAAYLAAATVTDSFFACGNRTFASDFARYTPTWVYEFAHRDGPGLTPQPAGYVWGAGHAAELAYLWPSFDNGTPIAPLFNTAERQLASQMVGYWSAFIKKSDPSTAGQPHWARWNHSRTLMSLNVGANLGSITERQFMTNHRCDFWDSLPG